MAKTSPLTPTSYAILGLLAIKPWTTYELAKQMDRTLSRFWPRARSKLYEEPKKLVAHGLAEADAGANGRRPRTVYSITPAGRRALAGWLAADSASRSSSPSTSSRCSTPRTARPPTSWPPSAASASGCTGGPCSNVKVGSSYLAGTGPYPERLATWC